jgi:hypothetical protein
MTDTPTAAATAEVKGKMFLYEKPELLNKEQHGSMGFTPAERPFDFVRNVRALPLTMSEFASAQRYFPIIFSNAENPVPLAIFGIEDEENLFVDDDGNWDKMCYAPTYLRCHPFAFASEEDGRMAVVVDMAAASVSDDPQYPFFIEGEVSEHTDALMQVCADFEKERARTHEYCKKIVELDLLTALSATHTPEGTTEPQTFANYISINVKKMNDLPADVVHDLHKRGFLSAMYLQLYSLENWRNLVARKVARPQEA